MPTPYEVLELAPGCTEAQVRQKYLELVRLHPPDRDPQGFAAIRGAYDALRDPETLLETQLFEGKCLDTVDDILRDLQGKAATTPLKLSVAAVIKLAEHL